MAKQGKPKDQRAWAEDILRREVAGLEFRSSSHNGVGGFLP